MAAEDPLKLDNQLCFPIYAASRLITRAYQPLLEKLGLTYPQYLVLLVLWEKQPLTVGEISEKLFLNTNTLTPLLQRLEKQELLTRRRATDDERKVLISLTPAGVDLKQKAANVPLQLAEQLSQYQLNDGELASLRTILNQFLQDNHG